MADISNDQSQMLSADQSQNNNNSPTQSQQSQSTSTQQQSQMTQQQQQQQSPQQQQQQQPNQSQQQQQQQQNQQPPYSVPGILHYLQYEWHRFEVERQEWEVERAELTAQIALLKGEKKSYENLKHDLIRRIKMLEYCLRMERAKYHKLKYGIDPPSTDDSSTQQRKQSDQQNDGQIDEDDLCIDGFVNSDKFAYGRSLLKHYLEEIGSTDNYIGLRSSRVRSLVGISDSQQSNVNNNDNSQLVTAQNQQSANNKELTSTSDANVAANNNRTPNTNTKPHLLKEKILSARNASDERAVLATFDFLYKDDNNSKVDCKDEESKDDDDDDDDENEEISEDMVDAADRAASNCTSEYSYFTDREFAEISNSDYTSIRHKLKLDLLKDSSNENSGSADNSAKGSTQHHSSIIEHLQPQSINQNSSNTIVNSLCTSDPKISSDVLDIGELATLSTLDSTSESTNDDYRRKQWTAKFRLQSHYDCVRDIRFVPDDTPLLVTVSEDETIKLWHLSKASSNSGKSRQPNIPLSINAIGNLESCLDLEPMHTYRGHTSRILCLAVDEFHIYTGAQNGELFMWKILKDPTIDQYDKFKKSLLVCKFIGHDDAVWALEKFPLSKIGQFLCSASADRTIKFWNAYGELEQPFIVINIEYSPTCMIWAHPDISKLNPWKDQNPMNLGHHIAVSSDDGKIRLYDIESIVKTITHEKPDSVPAKESTTFQPSIMFQLDNQARINSIVMHPRLPYLVSADSNHDIKFWDLTANECISSMVAHLDEVTSLAIDRNGQYLLSGSHDCSVRLWLFDERSCIQEITSHRKKFDEGIFAVAFHQKLTHFATAGADGIAKVFV